ncbi:hypothetical protein NBRC116493_28400 [Aurantivibrio infirmus]
MLRGMPIKKFILNSLVVVPAFVLAPIASIEFSSAGVQLHVAQAMSQTVSESVNKRLAKIYEFLNPEDENAKPDLENALKEAKGVNSSRWNDFEKAQLYQVFGSIYVTMGNYPESIKYYKLFIETESIQPAAALNVQYTLAQLYLATENYKEAIRLLEDYVARSEIVGAQHYFNLGQAYYSADNIEKARINIDKSIEMYEGSDRLPPESAYSFQMSIYYNKEDYRTVVSVLEKLVRHYPKLTYWKTLSSAYALLDQTKNQLAAYETIYGMGGYTQEKELLNIASMYLEAEYPYKAAKVIEKGINDKIIETTSKNLELLGASWSIAKERDKAIPIMEEAAKKSANGELYSQLAQIYLSNDNYQNSVTAGREALKRTLRKPATAHFTVGISLYELKKYDDAIKAFREVAKDKTMEKQARQWIQTCNSAKSREESMNVASN